jgi:hypothetical protein
MKLELLDFKALTDFPSGSGIECYDDKIYLVGDDAKDVLVMNKKWKKPTLINLFTSGTERAPKKLKFDLEATSIVNVDKKPHLLIMGSGSAEPRNKAFLVNLKNNSTKEVDLTEFYNRITAAGISTLNIEGAATVNDYIVLGNRGNKTNPDNYLIITSLDFFNKQATAPIQLLKVEFPIKEQLAGVSGLDYSDDHETLLLTISTEDTPNAIDDGPIGKSYLGIIDNFFRKIGREKIKMKINNLIDLTEADKQFNGYKIESVCIQSTKDHSMKLQMVADNDDGSSYLFKVWMSW